jgi:predicted phage replisome organizer
MAENRKYYFLKLKEDFFEQDTIVLLESLKDGVLYSNILMKMYLKSLQFNGFLKVNEHLSLTTEMIATLTRHEVGTVERALKIFLELGLAETTDTGTIYMSQIETLVGKSSTEGERKKLSRLRKEREKSTPFQIGLSDAVGQSVDICPQNVRTTLDICPPEIRDKSLENRDKNLDKRESKGLEQSLREKSSHTLIEDNRESRFYGRYGNVRLTDQEMEMLKHDFPADYFSMIEHMSEYMESSGKTYKNHLATMELWKKADMEKAKPKGNGYSYNGNFEEGDSL